MPSLYETTSLVKTILKWGGLVLGTIILVILLYRGGKLLATVLFPKKPDPPKVAFGKLPAIIFPENVVKQPLTFTLDTISGTLGSFPDRMNVFKTISPVPNLLNLQNTRDSLSQTPFKSSETYINDTQYSWRDISREDKVLSMNIVSQDFTISSNYLSYPDVSPETVINTTLAVNSVSDFLTTLNLFPLDLDQDKTTTQLLSFQGTTIFAATSVSTADLVRVDLFQKDLDKYPVVYSHPPYSSMHFLIGGGKSNEILEGAFYHQNISNDSTSYPLRSVADAYNLLKQNKAYIASYYGTERDISIKKIYLAYFVSDDKQQYILPVYVFEGKDGFAAYISAISENWIR